MLRLMDAGGEKRRFAYALRRARERRELTPPQLAALLGVTPGTVNRWEKPEEKDAPSILALGRLCTALGVKPELFADLPEEPPSPVDDYLLVQESTTRAIVRALTPKPARRGKRPAAEGSDG